MHFYIYLFKSNSPDAPHAASPERLKEKTLRHYNWDWAMNTTLQWLLLSTSLLTVSASILCLVLLVIRQTITVKKIKTSENKFRLLFDFCGVGLALIDLNDVLIEVNPTLANLLQIPPDELKGKTLGSLFHSEDDTRKFQTSSNANYHQADTTAKEKRLICPDGYRWVNVVRVPAYDDNNRIEFIVAVFMDIHERKITEQQLFNEQAVCKQILDTTDALLVILDHDGHVIRSNKKGLHASGLSEAELLGSWFWESFMADEEKDSAKNWLEQLRQKPETLAADLGMDFRLPHDNPHPTTIHWTFNPADPINRKQFWLTATGVDVTEERQHEQQVQHAHKMETLGTLVGGIAHDFNNQFTTVLGNLDLIWGLLRNKNHNEKDNQLVSMLRNIEEATQKCAATTRSLLIFSRRRVGRFRVFDFNQLLMDTCELLQNILPSSIALDISLEPNLWRIEGDVGQIQQVIINLTSNSKDAMPQGGCIRFETTNQIITKQMSAQHKDWLPGRYVCFAITDSGEGIPEAIQSRIFDPFFTTKDVGKGAGLGLAMVFGIVNVHKGFIRVESAENEGTTVSIYFHALSESPASEDAIAENQTPLIKAVEMDQTTTEPASDSMKYVLVVDDEEPLRLLAKAMLESAGFTVLLAENGQVALSTYREKAKNIMAVVLDLTMPVLSGRETLRELLKFDSNAKVIICSGYAVGDDAQELRKSGATKVIAKPYRASELIQSVQEISELNPVH